MLCKTALIACFFLMLGSATAFAQDAPLTDCDKYAASASDPQRKAPGVPLDKIDPEKAIPACVDILSQYPNIPRFQYQLGRAYRAKNENQNALPWFRKAAEHGFSPAQYSLGFMYDEGLGVSKDNAVAVAWYRKAADQGYAAAQISLGLRFRDGNGVPKDDAQAVSWFRKAAEQEESSAKVNLGWMYETGRGVPKDYTQAIFWYRKAADQGNRSAQANLGLMYEKGRGVPTDDALAAAWYRKAADQGDERAKNNLDKMYAERSVPKNYAQALAQVNAAIASVASATVSQQPQPSAQTVSTQSTEDVEALNRRVSELQKGGKYAEAIPLQQRVLATREKTLGPNHPDVAAEMNKLGELYYYQGRYADAELLYKRSLVIREKSLGPDDFTVSTSLNNLALVYDYQARYSAAEPLYKRALIIREKARGPDHSSVALLLNNLALVYDHQSLYAVAEPLYKRSLAIWEKSLGPDHSNVAFALNNLALLYKNQDRYADAEPLYQRSLAIFEKVFGPNHPDVGQLLNNLAAVYYAQGQLANAEKFYKRALDVYEKSLGSDHPRVGQSLNDLAYLYDDQRRYADAESLLKRSLAIFENSFGHDHPEVATALSSLAFHYRSQGRYAEAEPLDKRSLAIREKVFSPNNPDVSRSLNSLAGLYRAQGRYADALPLVQKTVTQGHASKEVAFPVLFQSKRQKLIGATSAFDDSYETEQRATSSAAANAVSKLAARFAAGTGELAALVRQDQDLTAEDERLDKSLIAAFSRLPAERDAAAEGDLRKRIEAIKSQRAKLQETFSQRFPDYVALSKPTPLSLQQTQALLGDDEALIVFDLTGNSYAWVITRTDGDWVELKVSAKDLETQVKALRHSLTFNADRSYDPQLAFKIYQATFGAVADRVAAKKRLSVVTNGALTSLPPALLVTKDPTGKALKDVDWLIRSYAITILPSVSSLKILRAATTIASASKPIIAFADPVFSRVAHFQAEQQVAMRSITRFYNGTQVDVGLLREQLAQLPGTRKEVQAIAKALNADANDIKLGLAVTETAIKQAKLDQYRITYFATHGLVAGDLEHFSKSKAEPALALTIPDEPNDFDDGLLSASEIAQLKLNADWVVLSACNTAAEDKPGAEALSGLARAFFYAGARSLIVSHWEVDDEATARLMTNTFQASVRDPKLSHGEALRQSMLAMIDAAKSDYDAHPRLWAPFVVVGEPAKPR